MKMSFFNRWLLILIGLCATITMYAQHRVTGIFYFNDVSTKSALISNSENDGRVYRLIIKGNGNDLTGCTLIDNYFNSSTSVKNTEAEVIMDVRFAPQSVGTTIRFLTLKKGQNPNTIQVFIDPLTIKRELF